MVDTDTTKVDKVAIRRDDKLNAESVIFAWGYWGWGNATKELVALIDAVEANRGFRSPVFVDVRKFRTVRARGFSGKAFETLLGVDRYHWLQGLGNETPQGPGVIIIDPNCVNDLLDIVQQAAIQNRRVLFFCSCEYPGHENETICCHRTTVARLIKSAAPHFKVVEWPGAQGEVVTELELTVSSDLFRRLQGGRMSIPIDLIRPNPAPLDKSPESSSVGGVSHPLPVTYCVPAGSIAVIRCEEEIKSTRAEAFAIVGPVRYSKDGWYLPLVVPIHRQATRESCHVDAEKWRTTNGYA